MRMNTKTRANENVLRTHEGGIARRITPYQELRRSVLSCLLWENGFYESGQEISERIADLVKVVRPFEAANLAIEAREQMKLRHAPLWIVRQMAKLDSHKYMVAATLERIIQRADELTEFLALYWKDGRCPLSAQVKKGLARAFPKFDAYQLAKYNRKGQVKLRDVLFLCHAKPRDEQQSKVWASLIDGSLAPPDTWEVALSSGGDKAKTFLRLMEEKKLGGLAFLRNLRNMVDARIPVDVLEDYLRTVNLSNVLPFRFISAAAACPKLETGLESAMFNALKSMDRMAGKTILLIDVSGSMLVPLSSNSVMNRMDSASALGMLLREICDDIQIWTFSEDVVPVPPRRGFALNDAIKKSQLKRGTYLGKAVRKLNAKEEYDRIIVITDEQSHDPVGNPLEGKRGYMINVGMYKRGVGYGPWVHIDGWSESVVRWIQAMESEGLS